MVDTFNHATISMYPQLDNVMQAKAESSIVLQPVPHLFTLS